METDLELLQRYARENSETAFAELVQRHLRLVYSTALRQLGGDAHLAQDISQTVFTALARKASSLLDRPTLAGWLYLSTHHAAAQRVRSDRRRRTREMEAHTMHELSSSSDAATDWDRVRPVLDDAMRSLSDADREAVLLRYFEQRPFAEIGDYLRLSEDAARMRVDRALDKLHALLFRRGITSTTAAVVAALGQQTLVAAPAGLAATITGAALAGGAASGVGATGITLFFMNKSVIIAGAVVLGALAIAVYEMKKADRSDAAIIALRREGDDVRGKLQAAENRAAQAEQQAAALKQDFGAASAKNSTPSPAVPAEALTAEAASLLKEERVAYRRGPSDPAEARRYLRTILGVSIDETYSALYRKLGLSPEQRERFKEMQLDRMERSGALLAAVAKQNPSNDRATLQTTSEVVIEQVQTEFEARLRVAFGEDAFQKIRSYQASLPARAEANRLARAVFYTEAPLTVMQAEQLVDLIANQARTPQGKVDLSVMNSEAMLAQAGTILSPAQLTVLTQLESQRLWRKETPPVKPWIFLNVPSVRSEIPPLATLLRKRAAMFARVTRLGR